MGPPSRRFFIVARSGNRGEILRRCAPPHDGQGRFVRLGGSGDRFKNSAGERSIQEQSASCAIEGDLLLASVAVGLA
jgi:hypothetical protein